MLEAAVVSIADFRDREDLTDYGDRRDGTFYRYTPDIKLAVRVALAVNRPLLVFGPSGCGKSSLVFNLARLLGRRYYEFVVNSRSEASDLYYRFDAVRRLGEAQLGAAGAEDGAARWRDSHNFIDPGPLWWVYSPQTARQRGAKETLTSVREAIDPGRWPPHYAALGEEMPPREQGIPPAVLLIDEIDKADPDFPNNLLVPLGSRQFTVEETGDVIRLVREESGGSTPLIVITSNRERELPTAFVRRCIVLTIRSLTNEELVELARSTFRDAPATDAEKWRRIAEQLQKIRGADQVSPAEFLDTINAIHLLTADQSDWDEIILRTAWTSTVSDGD
jgi:MoxR-like ATPase